MKRVLEFKMSILLVSTLLLSIPKGQSQCTLTSTMDTQAEIASCLTSCGCNTIVVNTLVDLTGAINLTSFGPLNLIINAPTGSLVFSGNGSGADELIFAANTAIQINPTGYSGALVQSGGTGTIRITVGTTTYNETGLNAIIAAGGNGIPLSTTLKSFKVNQVEEKNILIWETSSEINQKGFQLERKIPQKDEWTALGFVAAKGTSAEYSFVDNSPASISYYRLRQIDLDGKEVFSKIISTNLNAQNGRLKIYPNPVSTEGYLNIETADELENVLITNALGQVVLTSKVPKINIAQLPNGMYNLSVKTSNGTMTEKFLKQ